jgi:hypothetical protein
VDTRPGLNPHRLAALIRQAVRRLDLDLSGLTVLTEAASGTYVVTPLIAAAAGADKVYALARSTRYGSIEDVTGQTLRQARLLGIESRLEIITQNTPAIIAAADVITNTGHLRPIDAAMVSHMKPTAVVPLMYEAWEFRAGDVDLEACRARGILVAGTNECHADVDMFSFLGPMAVQQLLDAGVCPYLSSVLLLCNNAFRPYMERGLRAAGARLDVRAEWGPLAGGAEYDAIICALTPEPEPVLGAAHAAAIAEQCPGCVVTQYWGDIDRAAFDRAGVPMWPPQPPPPGHMGMLPSGPGPEPVVRLQSGGLKVGEVLARRAFARDGEYIQMLDDCARAGTHAA